MQIAIFVLNGLLLVAYVTAAIIAVTAGRRRFPKSAMLAFGAFALMVLGFVLPMLSGISGSDYLLVNVVSSGIRTVAMLGAITLLLAALFKKGQQPQQWQ